MVTWVVKAMRIARATIDLEPKIRTAVENLIILPKKQTIVSVCTTNVRSYLCLFVFSSHLLQQSLILDFLLVIRDAGTGVHDWGTAPF